MRRASLAGAATAAIWAGLALAFLLGGLGPLDRWAFDRLSALYPGPAPSQDVVIVRIDASSFQSVARPWPWPRAQHARLVEALTAAGARAVVFDVVFDAATEDDAAFADAIAAHGGVVLAAERAVELTPYARVDVISRPVRPLRLAAAGTGFANLPTDPDGRARRLPQDPDGLAAVTARLLAPAARPALEGWTRYRDPAVPFRSASYYQALTPEEALPEGFFEDAVVFVGLALEASPVARGAGADRIAAPAGFFDSPFIPGVEAHAHVFETLRAGDALRPAAGIWGGTAAALAFALSILAALSSGRRPGLGLAFGAAGLAGLALWAAWTFQAGVVTPVAGAATGLGLSLIASGFAALRRARQDRARLARGFRRYVAPGVLSRVLSDPAAPALGGARREITALVTDLEGSTGLMEKLAPNAQADLLRAYLDAIGATVLAHEGLIDQFIGDSVVALFNAPAEQPDHAARALACALAIDAAAERFRKDAAQRGLQVGATRIGVQTGIALVGNFGAAERFHYTAMGDVMNVASRLESAGKVLGCRVLIGAETAARAGDAGFRPAGLLRLAGRAEPVEAFAPREPLSEAALAAYRRAYAHALEGADDQARAEFDAAARLSPEDGLTAFHRARFERGEIGVETDLRAG